MNIVYFRTSLFGKRNIHRTVLRERQVERSGPEAAMQLQFCGDRMLLGKEKFQKLFTVHLYKKDIFINLYSKYLPGQFSFILPGISIMH